jgi:hypothetical protein
MTVAGIHEKKVIGSERGEIVLEHVNVHGRDKVAACAVAAHQYPAEIFCMSMTAMRHEHTVDRT